jgi:catechol 2,3-dioxygenase-like lactoylglutathione lyase family enzyme
MDMKLEVVPLPVRDFDAAKDFYTRQVGFHLDQDIRPSENMRVVQMTPPGSACSVVIGQGRDKGTSCRRSLGGGRAAPDRHDRALGTLARQPPGQTGAMTSGM